jgi:acyl-coenzyme A synthetase/AMP-(fatty) acid ligase
MLFTSGSTGRPKAVLHSHADFIACSLNYGRSVLELGAADCLYTPSRLFFAYGLNNLMLSLLAGASHVLAVPLAAGRDAGEVIEAHGVSVFMAVPAVYKLVLARATRPLGAPALRLCVSAGERLPARLHRQARAHFGAEVLDGIGCTEALSTFVSSRPGRSLPGCTGTVVPGFELRLLDERGEPCRVGAVGVLWVRGNTLAKRYASGEAGDAFVDGWFDTQDLFFADAAGRLHNVGRAGSVIKINACWFSPDTLEATLQRHPAVRDCAVCVVPDDYGMPRPKAFVVVDDERVPDQAPELLWRELRELSRQALGKDHYPHLFARVASLPRTASGKLLRHELLSPAHSRGTPP